MTHGGVLVILFAEAATNRVLLVQNPHDGTLLFYHCFHKTIIFDRKLKLGSLETAIMPLSTIYIHDLGYVLPGLLFNKFLRVLCINT